MARLHRRDGPNAAVKLQGLLFPTRPRRHALTALDFPEWLPALILRKVTAVRFMADSNTDEVYDKIKLISIKDQDHNIDDDGSNNDPFESSPEKPTSFTKTLTQSDANNGGGFSVPRYCAETIFPKFDYAADLPVQTVIVKDVHEEVWKFRHIYRGTPWRHLLTMGWSTFVNQKKLVAGDSIVFLRAENGYLYIGVWRAKKGAESLPSGWNSAPFLVFLRADENSHKLVRNGVGGNLRVRGEWVVEAAVEARGEAFEVVYYP